MIVVQTRVYLVSTNCRNASIAVIIKSHSTGVLKARPVSVDNSLVQMTRSHKCIDQSVV
jgi:hypothetical protein